MTANKVDFNSVPWGSVEWTNLVTLYLRACESRTDRTILGDGAAAAAVERIDYDFGRIHRTSQPAVNQYLVVLRAKQLDDWCSSFLRRHPDAVVLHLGCGLDSRVDRLGVPRCVQWFDLDQPGVIELRRRLYDETQSYRMIGASVTDPHWLNDIPAGRPTLVVAEGLLMYLPEGDVRQLLERLTDRFDCGELLFDTLSPLAPWLSKVLTRGIIKWGIGSRAISRHGFNKLRLLERVSAVAGYRQIAATPVRLFYRVITALPGAGSYDVLNRFEFGPADQID